MTSTPVSINVPRTGEEALECARELAKLIESEADKTESGADITQPIIDAFAETRLNWMVIPTDLGGLGLSAVDGLKVVEEIARADGSTAWAFMAPAFSSAILAGYLDDQGIQALFGGERPGLIAGMLLPKGTARRVDGGFVVDGTWGFASGSVFSDWIGAGFLVAGDDGKPIFDENGQPEARIALLPRDEVEFKGNWNVWGLVGTGSDDYVIREKFVPEHMTMLTFGSAPRRPEAIYRIGTLGLGVLPHAPLALGVAQRALEEVVSITATKVRPAQSTVVGDSDLFRHEFAIQEANLKAARMFVYDVFAQVEAAAEAGESLTPKNFARLRQVVTWSHVVAKGVVDFAHLWTGSSSIRAGSVMGRAYRDLSAATQHLLVDPSSLVDAAAEILPEYRIR